MTDHRWWATVGPEVHLLGQVGVTRTQCGLVLPTGVVAYDQPPIGDVCELCRLSYVADCAEDCAQRARRGTN